MSDDLGRQFFVLRTDLLEAKLESCSDRIRTKLASISTKLETIANNRLWSVASKLNSITRKVDKMAREVDNMSQELLTVKTMSRLSST